jgi:hypothetical protein
MLPLNFIKLNVVVTPMYQDTYKWIFNDGVWTASFIDYKVYRKAGMIVHCPGCKWELLLPGFSGECITWVCTNCHTKIKLIK